MKEEVRKRLEKEVGSVNRVMSIGSFLENKGRMLQGGRGISFMRTADFRKNVS